MNYSDVCEQLLKIQNHLGITEHLTDHQEGGEGLGNKPSIVCNTECLCRHPLLVALILRALPSVLDHTGGCSIAAFGHWAFLHVLMKLPFTICIKRLKGQTLRHQSPFLLSLPLLAWLPNYSTDTWCLLKSRLPWGKGRMSPARLFLQSAKTNCFSEREVQGHCQQLSLDSPPQGAASAHGKEMLCCLPPLPHPSLKFRYEVALDTERALVTVSVYIFSYPLCIAANWTAPGSPPLPKHVSSGALSQ